LVSLVHHKTFLVSTRSSKYL